jgi:hypothetical protein
MNILRHYFRRVAIEPVGVGVYILFPVTLLTFLVVTSNYMNQGDAHLINGRDVIISFNMVINLLLFQLMGSLIVIDFLYDDLRGDMRWRLLATPTPIIKFVGANLFASVLFAVISGLFILAAGAFAFNSYMHNVWVMLAVLVVMAIMSQLVGLIFFFLFKKKSMANTLGVVYCWGMALLSGYMFNISFGEAFTTFGRLYTPFAWAFRAIMFSGGLAAEGMEGIINPGGMGDALLNLGYLTGFTAVLAVTAFVLARVRGRNAA